MGRVDEAAPEFEYDLCQLPPGRVPFRRWRWALWHGPRLLRSGWRVTPHDAERALRAAASRRAHDLIGVKPLRPDAARSLDPFAPGATVRLDCGAISCVLIPRGSDDEREAAA